MRNKLAMSALALWVITLGVVGLLFVRGNRVSGIAGDTRTVIAISAAEREFILAEMRELLKAVHAVHGALAGGDTAAAIHAARRVGMGNHDTVVENAQPGLMLKIPLEMKKLGHATHRNFDAIASLLERNAPPNEVQKELFNLTSKCTACHNAYRLGR